MEDPNVARLEVLVEVVARTLPERFPRIAELRTAVLWWKACSVFKPDYWVQHLPDNPWIHQPFEVYDDLGPEGLKRRLSAHAAETAGTT